ncbi:MAG TPA: nucleotide-binding protein [Pyrinomonadaceae bacterium]|jgi:predicted nucleotide-binding protein
MTPKIFIGSSTEALTIARAIKHNLGDYYDVHLWKEEGGAFKLTKTFFDSLLDSLKTYDYGIFVLSPDDIANKRGKKFRAARDNVVFELGLYIGKLGPERCFFVIPAGQDDFRLPSDLLGVNPAEYDPKLIGQEDKSNPELERVRQETADITLKDACAEIRANIEAAPEPQPNSYVGARYVSDRLHMLRVAQTEYEVLTDVKSFIERSIYPGREIRIGFARKVTQGGRTILRVEGLIPPDLVHREFSYPQTMAAWALIEGKIFSYPEDKDYKCDFECLRKLGKFEEVRAALLATSAETDPILPKFLNVEGIKRKTAEGTLGLDDLYQDWISQQPDRYYKQFVSVPVPVLDRTRAEMTEWGVLNIDAPEGAPLVTDEIKPLLKLASDIIALGFEAVRTRKESGASG